MGPTPTGVPAVPAAPAPAYPEVAQQGPASDLPAPTRVQSGQVKDSTLAIRENHLPQIVA